MTTPLAGRVAIVTGGARNVGLGIATCLAEAGAAVALFGRSEDQGRSAVDELHSRSAQAIFLRTDVADPEQVERAVEDTVGTFGSVSILINNAAIMEHSTHARRIADMEVEHWNELLAVNLTGPFLCTKYAVPHLLRAGGGAIVNIGSAAAYWANAEGAGYGVSKAGLAALSRYTAADYGPAVRCNELILGPIRKASPIYDLFESDPGLAGSMETVLLAGRYGSPADVGRACVFLCSDDSAFITGASIWIDGGCHIASPLPSWDRIKAALDRSSA